MGLILKGVVSINFVMSISAEIVPQLGWVDFALNFTQTIFFSIDSHLKLLLLILHEERVLYLITGFSF